MGRGSEQAAGCRFTCFKVQCLGLRGIAPKGPFQSAMADKQIKTLGLIPLWGRASLATRKWALAPRLQYVPSQAGVRRTPSYTTRVLHERKRLEPDGKNP